MHISREILNPQLPVELPEAIVLPQSVLFTRIERRVYSYTMKEAACLKIQQIVRKFIPLIYHSLTHLTEESSCSSSPNNLISSFSVAILPIRMQPYHEISYAVPFPIPRGSAYQPHSNITVRKCWRYGGDTEERYKKGG